MRVVVVGGNGQVGRAVTAALRARGHDPVPVSRSSGVDAYAGSGLTQTLVGADAVLDPTRTPSLEERVATDYLRTSTTNLLEAEQAAAVRLHVPVSIVGRDRVPELGYHRAKLIPRSWPTCSPNRRPTGSSRRPGRNRCGWTRLLTQ